ncbi:hypothetical protein BDK51DRAFT_14360, partial [Blyttiomyces helicus]
LFCICRSADDGDPSRTMIGCDICQEWFHFTCVNLTDAEAEALDRYMCPVC